MFSCTGTTPDPSGDALAPIHNFSMPTAPQAMDFQPYNANHEVMPGEDEDAAVFHFLTTSEDGAMYVWAMEHTFSTEDDNDDGKSKKKKKHKKKGNRKKDSKSELVNQTFDGRSSSSENAVCARFVGDRIIVAAGGANEPSLSHG